MYNPQSAQVLVFCLWMCLFSKDKSIASGCIQLFAIVKCDCELDLAGKWGSCWELSPREINAICIWKDSSIHCKPIQSNTENTNIAYQSSAGISQSKCTEMCRKALSISTFPCFSSLFCSSYCYLKIHHVWKLS